MILVSIDTILWLMMTFAMAGPVLVSAIYEADIDSRILSYLQEKIRNEKLSTRQRAQLMYAVLVGNIDILAIPPGGTGQDTPWYDISGPQGLLRGLETRNGQMVDADRIASTKTRLRAMLAVQYSFGVTVGAPVVFFCGAFIGGLVGNFTHLGDNDTSHALGKCPVSLHFVYAVPIWRISKSLRSFQILTPVPLSNRKAILGKTYTPVRSNKERDNVPDTHILIMIQD